MLQSHRWLMELVICAFCFGLRVSDRKENTDGALSSVYRLVNRGCFCNALKRHQRSIDPLSVCHGWDACYTKQLSSHKSNTLLFKIVASLLNRHPFAIYPSWHWVRVHTGRQTTTHNHTYSPIDLLQPINWTLFLFTMIDQWLYCILWWSRVVCSKLTRTAGVSVEVLQEGQEGVWGDTMDGHHSTAGLCILPTEHGSHDVTTGH